MKKYLIGLFCLTNIVISCTQNVIYENVKIKDGIYINSSTGEILNGKYKSVSTPEHSLEKKDIISFEYLNGIPVGEWSDIYGGELIHSGKYLEEDNIKTSLQKLTECKRVDLNLWKESDYKYLTLELIQPKITDTLTLKKVADIAKKNLLIKYKFKEIIIDSIGDTNKNYIYEFEIK